MINFNRYINDRVVEDIDYLRDSADSYIENLDRGEIIELIEFYANNYEFIKEINDSMKSFIYGEIQGGSYEGIKSIK